MKHPLKFLFLEKNPFVSAESAPSVLPLYRLCSTKKIVSQKAMDAYAKVSIRLIGSSSESFNLQITRYQVFYDSIAAKIEDDDIDVAAIQGVEL